MDKALQREQTRKRVERYRNKQKDVTQYPAIVYALTDPEKRKKLEKIYHSLNEFKVADKVYYGISGIPFDVVGDLLEATE